MEIKKVEKFEFNGVLYDTENEAKIAAGIVGLGRIISYFSGVRVPDYRQELINLRSKIKAAAEAADILTAKASQPAPEAVQADWTDEDWPAKGWKKLKKKPCVKEPEDVQRLTVEDGIFSDRIRHKGETYIMETEEVKNKLAFATYVIRRKLVGLSAEESKDFYRIREIFGV